jgi:hypothetical protein
LAREMGRYATRQYVVWYIVVVSFADGLTELPQIGTFVNNGFTRVRAVFCPQWM